MMKCKNCVTPHYVSTLCLYFLCLGRNISLAVYPSNLFNALLFFLDGVRVNTDAVYLNSGDARVASGQTNRTAFS